MAKKVNIKCDEGIYYCPLVNWNGNVILLKCGDLYFKLKAHSYHYIRICTCPAITNTTLDTTPNVIERREEN